MEGDSRTALPNEESVVVWRDEVDGLRKGPALAIDNAVSSRVYDPKTSSSSWNSADFNAM